MLKLYGFSRVNNVARGNTRDLRVLWALEEMAMPFELVGIDHPAHELETDAYRAMNPFAQIPVIDDDGVIVTESAAILIYLAKKAGQLIPKDPAGEAQVLRWSFAAMSTLEVPLLALQVMNFVKSDDGKAQKDQMRGWANRHLGALERWLSRREFVAVDAFTVADILMTHVIAVEAEAEMLAPCTHVRAYLDRCRARPAWQRALEAYCARVEAG
ncbi:MAG TPA: glutathione S-transferase family protein [Kofleriaceae bacterium]|nr:glutathione S-transferase family protein [Kofleriaceae bacterium]